MYVEIENLNESATAQGDASCPTNSSSFVPLVLVDLAATPIHCVATSLSLYR